MNRNSLNFKYLVGLGLDCYCLSVAGGVNKNWSIVAVVECQGENIRRLARARKFEFPTRNWGYECELKVSHVEFMYMRMYKNLQYLLLLQL